MSCATKLQKNIAIPPTIPARRTLFMAEPRMGQRSPCWNTKMRAQAGLCFRRHVLRAGDVRQESCQAADERKVRTDAKNERNSIMVRDHAQHCGADAAHAECETKKEPCHESHFSGNEFLCVDQDGGKSR